MRSPAESVQSFFDKFAAGDLDGALALIAPDADWLPAPTLPWSRGEYRGPEGVREYLESFIAALEDGAATPEQVLGCEGDTVLALGCGSGRSRATGREFSVPFAFVFTVNDDGLIDSLRGHVDTATIRDAFVTVD